MSVDAEHLRDVIRHEWSYVKRYLENTGGPTLKIHLARLEAALASPEPEPAGDRSTSDGSKRSTRCKCGSDLIRNVDICMSCERWQ